MVHAKHTWVVMELGRGTHKFDTVEEARKYLQEQGYKYIIESATWVNAQHAVAFIERMRTT